MTGAGVRIGGAAAGLVGTGLVVTGSIANFYSFQISEVMLILINFPFLFLVLH